MPFESVPVDRTHDAIANTDFNYRYLTRSKFTRAQVR